MSWTYVDTSALVKLLILEPESAALASSLSGDVAVTSVLAAVELSAVVHRREVPQGQARVEEILAAVRLLPLSDAILRSARLRPGRPPLRALDLLHLATLRTLAASGTVRLCAYDHELIEAASAEGFAAHAPT